MISMKGDKLFIFFFLLPAAIVMLIFEYYPFLRGIFLSFHDMKGFTEATYSGIDNYRRLITDPVVLKSILNTFKLILYTVGFQVGIALILAVMIDSIKHGTAFFRTTFFFPVVISGTAIGLLFVLIYLHNGGLLNAFLSYFGFDPILWLTEKTALIAVAIPMIWKEVGFFFIILLTAIMKVPKSFFEAANLEGINGFQRLYKITIPLILNDLKVCLILAITGAFKTFEIVKIITNGGPVSSSEVLATYMYKQTFTSQAVGFGSTIAILIVILGVGTSLFVNRLLKQEEITY